MDCDVSFWCPKFPESERARYRRKYGFAKPKQRGRYDFQAGVFLLIKVSIYTVVVASVVGITWWGLPKVVDLLSEPKVPKPMSVGAELELLRNPPSHR